MHRLLTVVVVAPDVQCGVLASNSDPALSVRGLLDASDCVPACETERGMIDAGCRRWEAAPAFRLP